MKPAELSEAYIRSVGQRMMQKARDEHIDRLFRRPGNFKRACVSSASHLTILSVADRLTARQLAEILADAYYGLGLNHLASET